MAGKAVQFKRSLLINLTVGVAALGALMLGISLFATQQTVERLSGMLTNQVIATTDAQIMRFFEPIMAEIEIATQRTRNGQFETFPLDKLDTYFEPLIGEMAQVSSIMYSHENGDEYMLLQTGDEWTSRLSQPASRGDIAAVRSWRSGADERPLEEQVVNYNARERPWFKGALEKFARLGENAPLRERIHWTPPYRFFTTGDPGITASLAYRSVSGRVVILAFDILLTDISRYTSLLKIGTQGSVFVLRGSPAEPDGLVIIGLPSDDRFGNDEAMLEFVLSTPRDFGGPVASFVGNALIDDDEQPGNAVRFSHDGDTWWGGIAPSKLRATDDIWVGAVVPERELLAGLPNTNMIVLIVTATVLLFAALRAFRLANRYSAPVESLTEQGNRMQRLNFEPGEAVDSDITEIRHLSTTLERMRSALQSFTSAREDLRVARSIRDQNLPAALPTMAGLDIEVWQESAEELEGESYDVVADDKGAIVVGVFDCSATGLAAAIGSGQLHAEFRAAVAIDDGNLVAIAERLDRFVREERPALSPLRLCLLRIDDHRRLSVLGFGWDTLLHRVGNQVRRISVAELPLGLASPVSDIALKPVNLEPGDMFVLASDGVLDALTAERVRFGLNGVENALVADDVDSAPALVSTIADKLSEHSTGVPGDRTLVVFHVSESDGNN